MKGRLIQIVASDGEIEGLWYTEDDRASDDFIEKYYLEYKETEDYDDEGADGFEGWIYSMFQINVERVFVAEINL